MSLSTRWVAWRARGPEQLAVTLGLFLAGFFLLPTSKALNNVYYALVLAPALLLLRRADWRWLARSRLWWAALALLAYLTLSGLWSAGFTPARWLHEAKALPYLVVYLAVLACVCARRPQAWEWLLRAVLLAAVAGTLVSAVIFYRVQPWPARLEYYAAVYNSNEAATLVGGCVLLALFHVLPAARPGWARLAGSAVALILAAGVLMTGSRTPLAALLVCVGCGLALRRQWRLLAAYVVAVVVVGTALWGSGYASGGAVARGMSYRPAIWQQFAARVAASPWLGEGILTEDTTQVPSVAASESSLAMDHPHNVYLATGLYGGLPALALLAVVIGLALRQGVRLAGRGEPVWLLVLLLGLLCMLTDGDRLLHAPRGIWFYFWLPVGALLAREAAARSRREFAAGPVG